MKNRKLFSFFGAFVTLAMGTSAVKSYAIDSTKISKESPASIGGGGIASHPLDKY